MQDASDPVRRLCVALDVQRDSTCGDPEQEDPQRRLAEVLERASVEAGLDRLIQQQGDGLLLMLPSGVNETRVIAELTRALRTALWQHNRPRGHESSARLRLRLAFHQGITRLGDSGFVGRAVVTVCRLRDCDELRAALTAHPRADLAVIISQQLFEDVVEHEHRGLRKDTFWQVRVDAEGSIAPAWIHVPEPAGGADEGMADRLRDRAPRQSGREGLDFGAWRRP